MKTKHFLAVIALIALACLGALIYLRLRPAGVIANIYQDGACIRSVDLSKVAAPETFTVTDKNGHENVVSVEPGRICVLRANCPDQVCVHEGWVSGGTRPIVCLPAKLVIRLEDKSAAPGADAPDAVVG